MLVPGLLFFACAMTQNVTWQSLPDGELALVPFASAPYPHSSRADGYRTKTTIYPRDPHYTDSTVGIFVPKGFHGDRGVNFVVHFHGHNNHVAQVFEQYDLAHQMRASGVNAVLLVPQGPRDVPDSGDGKLEHDPGSLGRLLDEATQRLVSEHRIAPGTTVGHVALTAHSGGYNVASNILGRNEMPKQLTDVILFDATYGGLPAIADWCAGDRNRRLITICTAHLGHENAQLIALLQKHRLEPHVVLEEDLTPNAVKQRGVLVVLTTTLEHNEVISKRNFFSEWLQPLQATWGRLGVK